MATKDYKKGFLSHLPSFVPWPPAVVRSPDFRGLSYPARCLLMDVADQFNGSNNGSLTPSWELLKHRGWKSQTTLGKAKKEIRATRLITVTRAGRKGVNGTAELWAIAWLPLDYQPYFDIKPNSHDYKWFIGGLEKQHNQMQKAKQKLFQAIHDTVKK